VATRLGLTGRDSAGDEAQWISLQNELKAAAMTRLDVYPDKIADTIRDRLSQRAQPEDDPYGSAVQRVQMEQFRTLRLDLISAERDKLLVLRASGTYPWAMLDAALTQLDAEQIGIELRH
jgi:CPA1 family monovalent cation:H+ antiporter